MGRSGLENRESERRRPGLADRVGQAQRVSQGDHRFPEHEIVVYAHHARQMGTQALVRRTSSTNRV